MSVLVNVTPSNPDPTWEPGAIIHEEDGMFTVVLSGGLVEYVDWARIRVVDWDVQEAIFRAASVFGS